MRQFFLLALLFPLCLTPDTGSAQKTKKKTIFDLLYSDTAVTRSLVLQFDLDSLWQDDVAEVPAAISFISSAGKRETWDLKLEVRGRFRQRICDVPPLKLNFDKSELKDEGLKKDDQIKLVTHCLGNEEARENVIREWLVYRMYESLTDNAFRTQLVEVRYVDDDSDRSITNLGILIESVKQLGKRLDRKECDDCMGLTADLYDTQSLLTMAVFQYMIGNSDWSGHLARNMKALRGEEESGLVPVPYDFDFSGLVNTSYAIPNKNIGQEYITDRIYLGPPLPPEACEPVMALFMEKEEEIMDMVANCYGLSEGSKREIGRYLKPFFREVKKGRLTREIQDAPPLETRY